MPESNWSSSTIAQTHEERVGRQCRRGLSFFFWWWDRVRRRFLRSRGRLRPHGWISIPQAQQIVPVKSLLPQSMPTHLCFSSHSRCLIRDALRAQSDSRYWTLITVLSTRFHRPWICCHIHISTLTVVFLKDAGIHAHKKVDAPYTL
jgi:hypothetical protein